MSPSLGPVDKIPSLRWTNGLLLAGGIVLLVALSWRRSAALMSDVRGHAAHAARAERDARDALMLARLDTADTGPRAALADTSYALAAAADVLATGRDALGRAYELAHVADLPLSPTLAVAVAHVEAAAAVREAASDAYVKAAAGASAARADGRPAARDAADSAWARLIAAMDLESRAQQRAVEIVDPGFARFARVQAWSPTWDSGMLSGRTATAFLAKAAYALAYALIVAGLVGLFTGNLADELKKRLGGGDEPRWLPSESSDAGHGKGGRASVLTDTLLSAAAPLALAAAAATAGFVINTSSPPAAPPPLEVNVHVPGVGSDSASLREIRDRLDALRREVGDISRRAN
ncbi:MAG TPA: hypothetical protein VG916_00660 [Gemmatimonadaceae bacterium]|nr:hypothetical protein [Gemmatimonadaceae bacterium]